MKKRFGTICKVTAVAAALLGCQMLPVSAADEEKIQIRFMTENNREEAERDVYQNALWTAIDNWQEEHPEADLEIEYMDQTSYQEKINAVGSSGDMPDVFEMKGSWLNTFVQNGWVTDITDELDADTEWRDSYIENAFKFATKEDKIYGSPKGLQVTGVIYYNSALWSEIGYDEFPTTWAELLDAVEKFKEKGITAFVMGNKPNWPAESCWFSTLGDRFTGTDWTYSILDGSGAKFTDPEFVSALAAFQDLADRGAFNPDVNSMDYDEQSSAYFNGKGAAIVNGDWFMSTIESSAPDEIKAATRIAILPAVEGGSEQQNTVSGGVAWYYSLSTAEMSEEKRALCVSLIKAMTDQKMGDACAAGGAVSVIKNPVYDASGVPELFNIYSDYMSDKICVPIYDGCMDAGVIETMNTGLQSLLIDEVTPEELAESIQMEQELAQ